MLSCCSPEHSAQVDGTNAAGATPLHDAVSRGDPDVVRVLLDHGASNETVAKSGYGTTTCGPQTPRTLPISYAFSLASILVLPADTAVSRWAV